STRLLYRHPLPEGEGTRGKRVLHLQTGCNPHSAWITDEPPFAFWTGMSAGRGHSPGKSEIAIQIMSQPRTSDRGFIPAPSFTVLFSVVGLALYGLPFYYDYMVGEFGWSRTQVTSGNALSKFVVGPLFGFFAGWIVDRFGPRRLMLAGI